MTASLIFHLANEMGDYTEQQLQEMKDGFDLFDTYSEGTITYAQVGDVIRAFGQDPSNAEVVVALGNPKKEEMTVKKLTFEQFLPVLSQITKTVKPGCLEDFIEGLRIFDKENNGTIMAAELRHVLCTLGEKMTEEQVDQLMAGQEDVDGNVNYTKFCEIMMDG